MYFAVSLAPAIAQSPYYAKDELHWADDTMSGEVDQAIYLIGDAGEPDFSKPAALQILHNHLKAETDPSSVIFLGDNSYMRGLAKEDSPSRTESEANIQAQLNILQNFSGGVYFIPGNHDWDRWSKNGWESVKREEKFIEDKLQRGNTFLPDGGCPGPVEIQLGDNVVLIIIDTQWWLHQWEKPYGKKDSCDVHDENDFVIKLTEMIQENSDKQIIVAGHHPLYTNGPHGGHFRVKDHLFPLTTINKNLYLPLPGLGSIYPIYRAYISHGQDLGHPKYQLLKERLTTAFVQHDNLVYAAGHEHNLQYFNVNRNHHIVSGSGSKARYAARGRGADFTYQKQGFSKLLYMSSGEVWMEFWVVTDSLNDSGILAFRKKLKDKDVDEVMSDAPRLDFSDSTITMMADSSFGAGRLKSFIWGKHYREAWMTPIEIEVMDLKNVEGGLTPTRLGGGMQTKSLRLRNSDGNEFVFRSIQKDPTKVFLPEELQKTLIADIMKDQISMSHPFGAFVIPPLAKAAGIYHKNPTLVFVPDDPLLGKYRPVYKNTLALYEERAGKSVADFDNFGNAEKAISTVDLLEKMHKSHNNRVDEKDVLTNRLFDMWIGDWDRHDDQWRWAQFDQEDGKGHFYKAIPRDRDQVFAKADGLVLNIATRKFSPARKIAPFKDKITDVHGANINGRQIDNTFITELTEEDWFNVATKLRDNLTDSIIEQAIKLWPEAIYKIDGEIIVRQLKSRRDHLVEYAVENYHHVSKEVEVLGSDKDETFEIVRMENGNTQVTVYNKTKKNLKEEVFYQRTFVYKETKEIRLYGFGDDDRFELSGKSKKGILVRIIGGPGSDEVVDQSKVGGLGKLTKVYDKPKGMKIEGSSETRDLTSRDSAINAYDRPLRYAPNVVAPLITTGYNIDDGIFIGGGISIKKQKWRKMPHGSDHKILGAISTRTQAFNFVYDGNFYQAVKKWDLNVSLDVLSPNSSTNFYGLGNETLATADDDTYYWVRFDQANLSAMLNKQIGKRQRVEFGPTLEFIDVKKSEGRFISSAGLGLPEAAFDRAYFGGIRIFHSINTTDSKALPKKGIRWNTEGNWVNNLKNSKNLGVLQSDLSLFFTLNNMFKPTFAFRIGGATNIGDYQFYQAQTLGAQTKEMRRGNLRGYHRNRFAGRSAVYQNAEVRVKLSNFKTYVVPGIFGIYGFVDNGKVWIDDMGSSDWHHGYGGGIWISALKAAVLTVSMEKSREDQFLNLHMSFLF